MEFDKIAIASGNVELHYTEMHLPKLGAAETKRTVEARGKDPTPAFKRALQAFTSYVVWIIDAPKEWADSIEIRGVTIKHPDDEPRGIVVTALRTCKRARNSTLTMNTPFLSEPPVGYSGDSKSFLTPEILGFVEDLEEQAQLFLQGERGEQTAMALGDSENSKAFTDRAAAAETRTTRKPKGKKASSDQMPGVGLVANPNAGDAPLDDEKLRQLLLMVERDVPIDAFPKFTSSDRAAAERWALYEQRRLAKSLKPDEESVKEPDCVKKAATLPLSAEQWAPPKTVTVDNDAAARRSIH